MNTRATLPYPGFCDLLDTQGSRSIVTAALSVVDHSALHQPPASPANTETIRLLQHLLVQTQVSHAFLQPLDFILQQPADTAVPLRSDRRISSSNYKSGLRNAHLSVDFPDAGAGFSLLQCKCNLFFGRTGLFHDGLTSLFDERNTGDLSLD